MPERPTQITRTRARLTALLCVAGTTLLALGATVQLAAADAIEGPSAGTIEFTPAAAPSNAISFEAESQIPLGVAEDKVAFGVNKLDKKALASKKQMNELTEEREDAIGLSTRAQEQILALEELLLDAEEDEARLATAIRARTVEQYKNGEGGDLMYLLTGNAGGMLDRAKTLREVSDRDQRLIDEYEISIARIEQIKMALTDIRDIQGDRTERLGNRINRLGQTVADAKLSHIEDEVPVHENEADAKAAGAAAEQGAWFVMGGAFDAQMYLPGLPSAGGSYTGGARTPARRATKEQIQRVLSFPQIIDLDPSGYNDILTYQIDGRLLDAIYMAAQQFGYIRITSLKSDHGVYTASGNVSAHSVGCAVDIGTIGKTYITPGSQTPGSEVEQAVRFFDGLPGDLAPHQVISLYSLGGSTLSMGDHGDHIHLGYSC